MNKKIFTALISKSSKPVGAALAASGLFADFVKPFINFVPYFLLVSILILVGVWVLFARYEKVRSLQKFDSILQSRYGSLFSFAAISTLFWLMMIPIFLLTPQQGALSSSVGSIEELQENILGRFDRLETKMDSRFDEVLKKLESLDANAGIIGNPKSYIDHYHNAKIYELTGNALGARQSFAKYFEADLHFFDPFISYAQIIKSTEGPSAAQDILGDLRTKYPDNPAVHLTYAINKKDKTDQAYLLTKVRERFPDYGPLYFYIMKLNIPSADGIQTVANAKEVVKALAELDSLEMQDGFSKYFIDKKVLAENFETIRLARWVERVAKQKSNFYFHIHSEDLIMLGFEPAEIIKKVYYRLDGKGDFIQTGNSAAIIDGEPYPETQVMVSLELGKHMVEVKYVDREGVEGDVETFNFDIHGITVRTDGTKYVRSANEVEFNVGFQFYKTNLNQAILQYSMDNETFDQRMRVGRDPKGFSYSGHGFTLTNPKLGKHTLYARLKFPDGKIGEVVKHEFEIR